MRTAIVPYERMSDIQKDLADFANRDDLNGFQKWIVNERAVLHPDLPFTPLSLITAAVPFELGNAVFSYGGKRYAGVFDGGVSESAVKACLAEGNAYHYYHDYWLPVKRLAVRSGLAYYGRNNICYVEGLGSLITLFCFITDMPCPPGSVWRGADTLPGCESCGLCVDRCPTGAIRRDRFLIDNMLCLSALNEQGDEPFPDFVPKQAHHRPVNCSLCQDCCPDNAAKYRSVGREITFDEAETALILSAAPHEGLPEPLKAKITECGLAWVYQSLPRNLTAWFESGNGLVG